MTDTLKTLIESYPGARPDGGFDDLLEWASSAKALLEDLATREDADARLSELHARLRQALGVESVEEAFDEIANLTTWTCSEQRAERDDAVRELADAGISGPSVASGVIELAGQRDALTDGVEKISVALGLILGPPDFDGIVKSITDLRQHAVDATSEANALRDDVERLTEELAAEKRRRPARMAKPRTRKPATKKPRSKSKK